MSAADLCMCVLRWLPLLTTHPAAAVVPQLTHPRSRSLKSQLRIQSQMKPILAVAGPLTAVVVPVAVTGRHTL